MRRRIRSGVAKGLHEEEFVDLHPDHRRLLLTIMARISESSFRRGLQHGLYFAEKDISLRTDPWSFRYRVALDKSPCIDNKGWAPTALERLKIQYGSTLLDLGFAEMIDDAPP